VGRRRLPEGQLHGRMTRFKDGSLYLKRNARRIKPAIVDEAASYCFFDPLMVLVANSKRNCHLNTKVIQPGRILGLLGRNANRRSLRG